MTLEQVQAIRAAAAAWRSGPGVMGPKPDGQVKDAIEVLLGTSMRPGEALALRPCDIFDGERGMVAHIRGAVAYREGRGTFRQDHPKSEASIRHVPVPAFAARVIRRPGDPAPDRVAAPEERDRTIFANRRNGGPLSQHNFRRTCRELLVLAGLDDSAAPHAGTAAPGQRCSLAASGSKRRPHTWATRRTPRPTTSTCRLSLRKIGCTSHRTIQHDAGSVHTARSASPLQPLGGPARTAGGCGRLAARPPTPC
jgi:Phage integrase family